MGNLRSLVALGAAIVTGSGCTLGPTYARPAVPVPETFRETGAPPDAASIANLAWFDLFEDEALRALVSEALEANKDLGIAASRVDQARARFGVVRADRLPELDAGGRYDRQRFSEVGTFAFPSGDGAETDVFALSAEAGFELDVFGRLRSASEAARAELLASEAARRAVVVALVGDVARTYLELRELDLELDITRRTVDARRRSLGLVRDRLDAGLTTALDLRQAESDLATTAAEIPGLERRVAETEHLLSLLLGRNPGGIRRGEPLAGRIVPPRVPAGLPSAVLERRPDVLEAEQRLVAANARIGAARAAFFPRITLTGAYGVESVALSDLFTGPARAWQFGPRVTVPIFQGGRNRATLELREAERDEAVLLYQRAIQQAFRETEDALVAHRKARRALREQRRAVRASREAFEIAESRYSSGLTTYLSVLETQRTLLGAELAESRTMLSRLAAVVDLYRALGGGWDVAEAGETLPSGPRAGSAPARELAERRASPAPTARNPLARGAS